MEIARLVLEYLKVMAWPVVVTTLLVAYRSRVAGMLSKLSGLTAGGFSATFDSSVAEATALNSSDESTISPFSPSVDELTVLVPTSYVEAREIGDYVRADKPVLLDLQHLADEDAKRLVDFAAGLTYVSSGWLRKVRNRIFLVMPGNLHHDMSVSSSNPVQEPS
ncbi:cell division protein SepF [Actinopolyspora saharensis]|uniref:Cell division protein SepF n=1 Tax=Actinopolyspora saharensis TaxID=995062 RepID=A0A1H0YH83_9ACTN|nr:cell division protein SepF [Actinopolyspora saharensis]SDQ14614.1 Protein of unknown function [Actinopolyspora saharensis]